MNTAFETSAIVDTFESFIWTDRYDSYGDFEIVAPLNSDLFSKLPTNNYIQIKDSNHTMIIEEHGIKVEDETGAHLKVTGRSLETILERRIVWKRTILEGNLQTELERLLNENAISPIDINRKITNLIFQRSTDSNITDLTISAQYTGDNLYTVVQAICSAYDLGFKITLNTDNLFVFEIFKGVDRSHNQTSNSYVIFSPEFSNLLNSEYFDSQIGYRNVALIGGEGEGALRRYSTVDILVEGLERHELFVDARDISSTIDGGTLSEAEYIAQLNQRGEEALAVNTIFTSFQGEVAVTKQFVYGIHFFMGDIVQIINEYGMQSNSKVYEILFSQDTSKMTIIPTFVTV